MDEGLRGFDEMIAWLEVLPARLEQAADEGLEHGADILEASGQMTRLYRNDTGATRGSTVAYVDNGSGGDRVAAAYATAQQLNPQRTEFNTIGGSAPETSAVVLTNFTAYNADLVTQGGGAQDWITEAMYAHANSIMLEVARRLREVFR